MLNGKVFQWLLLLVEFAMTYITTKIVKGLVVANHCTQHQIVNQMFEGNILDKKISIMER